MQFSAILCMRVCMCACRHILRHVTLKKVSPYCAHLHIFSSINMLASLAAGPGIPYGTGRTLLACTNSKGALVQDRASMAGELAPWT